MLHCHEGGLAKMTPCDEDSLILKVGFLPTNHLNSTLEGPGKWGGGGGPEIPISKGEGV